MKGMLPADIMQRLVDGAPEGIVICEVGGEDQPVIYVNRHFEQLTGYAASELLGTDLRRLQDGDRDQDGRALLRAAIKQGRGGRALLRNYRKDGTPFWNEVLIEPLRKVGGAITHFVGYHRGVEAPQSLVTPAVAAGAVAAGENAAAVVPPGLPRWVSEDRLTGLSSRASFEELLRLQWEAAQREGRALTLLMFEIDSLASYRDTFGRTAVDACIRKVARLLAASFRRGTDLLARWEEGSFCVLSQSVDLPATQVYAQLMMQRVFEMQIHHPRASRTRFVTLSSGVAQLVPAADASSDALIAAATAALRNSA